MSDTHGPAALVEYLEARLAPGQSIRSFCAEHRLDPTRISAWRHASGVSIEQMREFADAVGLRLGQVMVIAGYGTPEDFGEGSKPPPPPEPPPLDVHYAIQHDPSLTKEEREVLESALALVRRTRQTGRGTRKIIGR